MKITGTRYHHIVRSGHNRLRIGNVTPVIQDDVYYLNHRGLKKLEFTPYSIPEYHITYKSFERYADNNQCGTI